MRKEKRLADLYELCGNKCAHCGLVEQRLGFYDFHHVNPEEKEYAIGKIMNCRWDRIISEVKKCVMLCPNCHRLEHIRLRNKEYDK